MGADQAAAATPAVAATLRTPESYGLWTITPALVAIACAIITRQVVPSLLLGVVVAAGMLIPCLPPAESFGSGNVAIRAIRLTMEGYVIGAIVNVDHVKILLFTLIIGAMVGVVGDHGGTAALVEIIAKRAASRRRGQLTAWLAGLVVFFDDYANSMIVGPTMQPICDRLRISRAKLAYIVDSTAAPVASIAMIGTWVGAEIGYIDQGLDAVKTSAQVPEFLKDVDGWHAFLNSIPYRFYPIFAIILVFLVAVMGRELGAMHRSERRVIGDDESSAGMAGCSSLAPVKGAWWVAGVPILLLVIVTCGVLVWPGMFQRPPGVELSIKTVFQYADPYASILYGALASAMAAVLLTALGGFGSLKSAMDASLAGMARVYPALVVLVLAWALSSASTDLHVGEVVRQRLVAAEFSITWLPVAVFASAAGVSFATGTSWGTMGILCPMVVTVAAGLAASQPHADALSLFYASVGSVLAGSIFGDHCSPISDTTVLSAIASGCSLEEHVWTQIPYALMAAVVGMTVGDTLCNKLAISPWIALVVGTVLLAVVLRIMGRCIDDTESIGRPPA